MWMWWKMSGMMLRSDIVARLSSSSYNGDSNGGRRVLIFFQVLCSSVEGLFFCASSNLCARYRFPMKQCEIVWGVLVEEGVLRECSAGYSAIDWMRENRLVGEVHRNNRSEVVTYRPEKGNGETRDITQFLAPNDE